MHPIFYKYNPSVSRICLPRHLNRHSKQSIYVTNILNIFIDFKKFLTIFNSSVDYNFVFCCFKFYATFDDNFVIPKCILTLYTDLITVLFKLINVFWYFRLPKLWKTIALMECSNSFNFSRQIYRTFIVSIFSLFWLKKFLFFYLLVLFLLMLIDSFKNFWRFVKRNLLKAVIARSPGYFIVLMLILYNHGYVTNCTNTLRSVDVSVSVNSKINGSSIYISDKNFNSSFYKKSRKARKLTCWHPKVVEILKIWISCPSFSYFCFLLIFWENWKMILASELFLLVSLI